MHAFFEFFYNDFFFSQKRLEAIVWSGRMLFDFMIDIPTLRTLILHRAWTDSEGYLAQWLFTLDRLEISDMRGLRRTALGRTTIPDALPSVCRLPVNWFVCPIDPAWAACFPPNMPSCFNPPLETNITGVQLQFK